MKRALWLVCALLISASAARAQYMGSAPSTVVGGVSSVTLGQCLASTQNPITSAGTVSLDVPVVRTASSVNPLLSCKVYDFRQASTATGTLPTPTADWTTWVQNNGGGALTITPPGGVSINGATAGASIAIGAGSGGRISWDNTNSAYTIILGGSAALTSAAHSYKGNNTGSSAATGDITVTQLTADLNACTSTLKGLVPAPPNDASKYLDGTCAFSTPSGTIPSGVAAQMLGYAATGSVVAPFTFDKSFVFDTTAKTVGETLPTLTLASSCVVKINDITGCSGTLNDFGFRYELTGTTGTITITAIATGYFQTGQGLSYVSRASANWNFASTPTINKFPCGAILPGGSGDLSGSPDGVSITWSGGSCGDELRGGAADQTVAGGANVTSLSLTTGSITVDCGSRPLQYVTNGGSFTLTAPANDGSCIVQIENNGSAGTVSFSGFSTGANTGDALDTTNGHIFQVFVSRVHAHATYRIGSLQ